MLLRILSEPVILGEKRVERPAVTIFDRLPASERSVAWLRMLEYAALADVSGDKAWLIIKVAPVVVAFWPAAALPVTASLSVSVSCSDVKPINETVLRTPLYVTPSWKRRSRKNPFARTDWAPTMTPPWPAALVSIRCRTPAERSLIPAYVTGYCHISRS